jgi:Uma2 family endonuclease
MSTVTAPPRLLTPDDVEELPNGKYCELVDGQLVEKPMGTRAQYVGVQISWQLMNHCRPTGLAHVIMENAMVCFPSKPNQMRRPDVMVILSARLPFDQIPEGLLKIRPDLVVEVISPNDKVVDLEKKLDDFRDAGIPLVWLVYPQSRRVRVIRHEGPSTDLGPDDDLTGELILPDFRCRVSDLFGPSRA